jgi:hypothetical protein
MKFYAVSPEALKEAEQSGSTALVVPEDARPDNKDPDAFRWAEAVTIEKCEAAEQQWEGEADMWQRFSIHCRISPEGSGKNSGRMVFGDHRINTDAFFKRQNKEEKAYKQSKFTITMLSRLLAACGYEWDKALGIPPKIFEEVFGEKAALVGQQLWVEIKQGPMKTRNAEGELVVREDGRMRSEITRYSPYA